MKNFIMNLLLSIATTANNLASKLATNPAEPLIDYEPVGAIHRGEFHITLGGNNYSAYNQPDGRTVVWVNDQPLGDYTKDGAIYAIIDHAKGRL